MREIILKIPELNLELKSDNCLSILDILNHYNVVTYAPCGGHGKCGKCKIQAFGDLTPISKDEKKVLSSEEIKNNIRLACKTYINSDAAIKLLYSDISAHQNEGSTIIEITDTKHYGAAIDIGTSTLACYILELDSGKQISAISTQNTQCSYGADVISRINYAIKSDDNLKRLKEVIQNGVNNLIQKACKNSNINPLKIKKLVLVGNTVMNHLFCGFPVITLAALPFTPFTKNNLYLNQIDTDLSCLNKDVEIIFLQNIDGFVGSDTTGCIIKALEKKIPDNTLLIDLGTNGEVVLFSKNRILTCSTAAGPAFEGANIKYGMQAFNGAINSFIILNGNKYQYTTIGNTPPAGICGSGLIDITAEFIKTNLIDSTGRINNNKNEIIIETKANTAISNDIVITQKDIREIQLSKAAIRTGIEILMDIADINTNDINSVYLTGAFGCTINKFNARYLGILPNISIDKIATIDNAAGAGAMIALSDNQYIDIKLPKIMSKVEHIEISTHKNFQKKFVAEMNFNECF